MRISRLISILKYVRFRPFDQSTLEGQARERNRRIALSTFSGIISQSVNYPVMILMVPLLLHYLGKEQFGLWLAISSGGAVAQFGDLGLGNGLVNLLGKAVAHHDQRLAKSYVSSAVMVLCGMAAIMAILGSVVVCNIDFVKFFQISDAGMSIVAKKAVAIYFLFLLANVVFGVGNKIRIAFQEVYINNFQLTVAKVLMLTGVLVGIACRLDFLYFIVILAGAQVVTTLINCLAIFGRSHVWIRPDIRHINYQVVKELFASGGYFFIAGIGGMLAIQLDSVVIGRFLGVDQVPSYAVPLKLYMIAGSCLSFVLTTLWPAFREGLLRDDLVWVKRTFWRSFILTYGIISLGSLVLIAASPVLVRIWTGGVLDIGIQMRITLGIYAVVAQVGPMAMLLNGANILKPQAIFTTLNGVFNLVLSIFLVQKVGLIGPLWGTIIAQIIFGWGMTFYYIHKLFSGR